METNARYGIIGAFTLAVIAAGFIFVYWLHSTGGSGDQSLYRLRFNGSVAGLRAGSAVLFNGIRVGEVKGLRLDPDDPLRVEALIGIDPKTPLRADTRVVVETQGLMGSPAVLLAGGSGAPLAAGNGPLPTLDVAGSGTETLTQSALGVLRRMDKLLADNSEPINNIVAKISTFSDALGRNADRIDSIAAGLDRMVGGDKDKKPTVVYDLTVPASFKPLAKEPAGKLAILEPGAMVVFDTQKMLVSAKPGERSVMTEGQWSDSLPKLVQTKIVESFEKTGYLGHVVRGNDMNDADLQLQIDIRDFQIATGDSPKAVIQVSAKLQGNDGQIKAARILKAEAPLATVDPAAAAQGFSTAFSQIAGDLIAWADETM